MDRVHVAEHEAAHAVVAKAMGLPVTWVTIDPGCDEGINFTAAVKIPDEGIDYERDVFAISVAMAAPHHLHHSGLLGKYAALEYRLATEVAGRWGYPLEDVFDTSERMLLEHEDEHAELARRLNDEGTVSFDALPV